MDIYTLNLLGLLGLCTLLFGIKTLQKPSPPPSSATTKAPSNPPPSKWPFLTVYALVMASDWLQGPFLYPLYHDTHRLPPPLITTLFTTGFLSAAGAGSLTGSLADRHGRKAACLAFCGIYAASCALTAVGPSVPLLVLGRVLGGVGTSLLFSVFESWMVADWRGKGGEGELGGMFGVMGTVNSLVAIACGVGSEWVVGWTGRREAPFWGAVGCCVVAAGVIWGVWDENYGEAAVGGGKEGAAGKETVGAATKKSAWAVLLDPRVLALGLCSTIFEGSMYLFVFFWAPALRSMTTTTTATLPYGVIFAAFMAATLASSLAFGIITARKMASYVSLLLCVLGSSSICFLLSSRPASEQSAFWVFCAFEAAVGMYFPSMGYMKGRLVDDGVRAQVYGMLRVPLNVFVVVSLMLTGNGAGFEGVFFVCSSLLMLACSALWLTTTGQGTPQAA
ncbi:hypothetical protein QBC39DRAFT_271735 [Podospora conica]|nr:hypothetical protein QBC39DRAFT_271735 [Schizothecium conicum]